MTAYVILGHSEEGWKELGTVDARSAQAAVRELLDGSDKGGEYVAVPARSFKPVTVKVETKRSLRFS